MKSQLIHQDAQRTYALIFDKGDEFISEITRSAKSKIWLPVTSRLSGLSVARCSVSSTGNAKTTREFRWILII
jgi:hypothetical protein